MAKFTQENYLAYRKQGLTQREMASRHGVSEAYVSKVKRRCEGLVAAATPQVIQTEVLSRQHDALEQLANQARELSGLFQAALDGDWKARGKLQALSGVRGDILKPYIALPGELRKLLELDNTIKRTKFDIERIMRFQETVMGVLQEVSPEVAAEVVRRHQALDARVSALDFGIENPSSNTY